MMCMLFADPPWSVDVQVSQDPGSGNQNETTMGIFGDTLLCGGWNDNRQGLYHVGFARSVDGGVTWQETLMIEPSYPSDGDPVIAIDDAGVIYYFWLSFNSGSFVGDIFLTKSTDWGQTWQPSINCTPGSPSTLDDKPWARIDGNDIFLTWYEYGGSGGLNFKRSTDYGASWSAGVTVGYGGNGTMAIRGTGSDVFVGWGFQDIRLNKSTDMGQTWQGQQTIIPVTWDPPYTPYRLNNVPCFDASNDHSQLYVVFACSRFGANQLDVLFSRSTNGGSTWTTPIKVNDTPPGNTSLQFYPFMAVDDQDNIHVVWHDSREGGTTVLAQYYAYSTDHGQTWSPNERISDASGNAQTFIGDYTACAVNANHVFALWCDCRNGSANPDVFFSSRVNDIGVQEQETQTAQGSTLRLSFPNPLFRGSEISYWPLDAKLSLYRIDGRKVAHVEAPGVYFVELSKGTQHITKKLIVVE